MAEYLDNIFTDEDLASQEFLDAINAELTDITGYEVKDESNTNQVNDSAVDPLDEVLKKEEVEIVRIEKNVINDLKNEDKVKILKRPLDKANISIDENNDIFCKTWGNYYIIGGDKYEDSIEIINEFLDECKKPKDARDLNKFIVGKKTVIEKFNDMNLHRGSFDLNGFYENVVN